MTDIDEHLEKLLTELADLNLAHQSILDQAEEKGQECRLLAARIEGIKEGYDHGTAYVLTSETLTQTRKQPVKASEPTEASSEQPRRERRKSSEIRELVYVELSAAPLGMTVNDLMNKLDAAKTSVVGALTYHEANDAVIQSKTGIWRLPQPAQSNGEDTTEDVVEAIRSAGEEGTTEDELFDNGYTAGAIVRAINAGKVETRLGRLYAVD